MANDYTLVGSQLTIAAGETTSTGTVTITAVNNAVYEGDKQVTVSGTATNDQGVGGPDNVTLTITEDDAAPGLSVADASVDEGDTGSATMTFTVRLTPAAVAPVTVEWATSDGTATAGTDYTAGNGTLTFDAQDSSKTFTVTVAGDEVDEPNETFTVTLSNASGATLGNATATGTITDDDPTPRVTLVLSSETISENGGTSMVTATLDRPSSEATTVTVSVTPESPAVATDYTLSGSPADDPGGRDEEHGYGDDHRREQRHGRPGQDGDGLGHGDERPGGRGPAGRDADDHRRRRAGAVDRRRQRGRGRFGRERDDDLHGDAGPRRRRSR